MPARRLRAWATKATSCRSRPTGVRVRPRQPAGLFYGIQTLRQLLPPVGRISGASARAARRVVPAGHIVDRPRFAWRGAMLDVARHFFTRRRGQALHRPDGALQAQPPAPAPTDDQGWRIEIKSWPNLTTHGGNTAVGGGAGRLLHAGATTRDIVAYARERFITIVPEIDMPGHTNAALASYAELNCDGERAAALHGHRGRLQRALRRQGRHLHVPRRRGRARSRAMTPGPYFHIGGDEVKTLTPAQYRTFIERVQAIVEPHGKR